jgi:hypothetical protein
MFGVSPGINKGKNNHNQKQEQPSESKKKFGWCLITQLE